MIVLIDDEKEIRNAYEFLFCEYGYDVKSFEKVNEAVNFCRNNDVAIVIVDYIMPEMTGEKIREILYQINPNLKFILLTGFLPEKNDMVRLQSLFEKVLYKPIRVIELIGAIEE